MNQTTIPIAQLIIGPCQTALLYAKQSVQRYLNECQGCGTCKSCVLVENREHEHVLWIEPEKRYTIEIINTVLEKISYQLPPNSRFFCVITKAHLLPQNCSDRLLKLIEEPPLNYYFLLLTPSKAEIAPTIASRCHSYYCMANSAQWQPSPWYSFFTTHLEADPADFLALLYDTTIIWEDRTHLDYIMSWWQNKDLEKQDLGTRNYRTAIISVLATAYKKFVMPGSGKIFWKNLFLEVHSMHHIQQTMHTTQF